VLPLRIEVRIRSCCSNKNKDFLYEKQSHVHNRSAVGMAWRGVAWRGVAWRGGEEPLTSLI
jgi:hypothetical protein